MRVFPHDRPILATLTALLLATVLWLPAVHLLFKPRLSDDRNGDAGLSRTARALAAHHLYMWADPAHRRQAIAQMRASNAEWDFMARTFFVLALANIALRDPSLEPRCLDVIDTILDETLRLEQAHGQAHFLMPYARYGAFVAPAGRSLFLDGEIGMMMAARRLVQERDDLRPLLAERVALMRAQMAHSPVLSGESYPDECWTFCNSIALATMRAAEALDGESPAPFARHWLATARERLVDPRTGLLVSSYRFDGTPKDGPEGSSIWTVAHFLRVIDREFAADQYRRARRELAGSLLGFGYAREWPASWRGPADIDSGPIIPILDISLGSSGQALLGATTFHDPQFAAGLLTSLRFGGFPVERDGRLRFAASNAVGDAVVLYALVQGPLWERLEARVRREGRP
jgi:hypothetical protein